MAKVIINKEELLPQFMSGNIINFGAAAGCLKPCAFKLYVYLMCNADGFHWTLNPAAFANWQGLDNNRNIRRQIEDGLKDLVQNGFAKDLGADTYEFFEKQIKMEQIIPKMEENIPTNVNTMKMLGF